MFDRSDLLWREEPTPAEKPARDNDQARQVTTQPGAPGHTRDPDDRPEEWRESQDIPLSPEGQAACERAQERARHGQGVEQDTPAPRERPEPTDHQDRQARAAGRTWTTGREWTDQDRPAPTEAELAEHTREARNRQIEIDAWKNAGGNRQEYRRRPRAPRTRPDAQARPTGHRREHDARAREPEARDRHPARRTIADRKREAVADVALYRAVSYTDLSDQHFDGHPYATRRAVNHLVRAGLVEEHEAQGPEGHSFTVLTATDLGREAGQRAAVDAGHVPEQQTWTGVVKPAELSHDTAVYRAALDERARLEADGGRVTRVRLDAELKASVATATERARADGGDRAAHAAKLAAADDLGLHVVNHDQVMYPDAQLDIEDAAGVSGRVNVEIVSDHYHASAIVAKAAAGYALHGSSRSASANIGRTLGRAAARETDSGPGGGSPSAGRDGSVEL